MGTKNNPGKFDCYAAALPDEPLFTLLARDPSAPSAVLNWISCRTEMIARGDKPQSDMEMVREAQRCADDMAAWRAANEAEAPWRRLVPRRVLDSAPVGLGFCPICGAAGETREKRPNGNDTCRRGHVYKSSSSAPLGHITEGGTIISTGNGVWRALKRDAERYRWLRARDLDTIDKGGVFAGATPENVALNGLDLDAAVDEGMGREPTPKTDPEILALRRALAKIIDANDKYIQAHPAAWTGPINLSCDGARPLLNGKPAAEPADYTPALRAGLRSMMRFLHGLCCMGCKAQGRELNRRCCKDADCDAGFYGVHAETISALLELGEVLMPGTLAEIEAPAVPVNQEMPVNES